MKVLFWLDVGFDRHGPSVHLLKTIIEETIRAGNEVAVILRNTGGTDPNIPKELAEYDGLTFEVYKDTEQQKGAFVKRYLGDVSYYFKTRKLAERHKDADVVFLQSCYLPLVPICIIHKKLKMPVLFNVQNIFPIDAGVLGMLPTKGIKCIPYNILRKLQQSAYQKSECVVTISEDMRTTLLQEKTKSDSLAVVYNWSYSDEAAIISEDENLFLMDNPNFKDKFRVVFAGNMGAMVNPNIIADAAEKLLGEKEIQFIIIGGGNNMQKLQKLARNKRLPNMAFFPYQPEEYARHNYAMANVNINALPQGIIYTCMPSKTATMLNSSRPMVVAVETDSDYARILHEVDRCHVVDWNDTDGFADAILSIYKSGNLEDSSNSRDVFKKYCSVSNAKQYVKLLEATAEKGMRR